MKINILHRLDTSTVCPHFISNIYVSHIKERKKRVYSNIMARFSDSETMTMESTDVNSKSESVESTNSESINNVITVKFIVDCNNIYTQSFNEQLSIEEVKNQLTPVFNIPPTSMLLSFNNTTLEDQTLLKDLGTEAYGVLELKIASTEQRHKICIDSSYREDPIPDVITVRVQTLNEGIKDVVVEVENRSIVKPFLGGFIDKQTLLEFHHGYTQTGPPKPKVPPERKNHRDTQTYFMRNRKLDMEYSQATQMTNTEIWIPCVTDKILTAGPYETAEEREKRLDIEGKVRTIQRYFRSWKMKKALHELSAEYHKRLRLMQEREELEKREDMERKKRDLISRVFPRTAADFSMLYAMTERWKKAEIKRIVSMHCGPSKIAEFYLLLEKEIEILRSIEALRQKMKQDRKIQRDIEFFKLIGDPWKFISSYKDIPVWMDTIETQKGREFRELYKSICDKNSDVNSRIQVYINLKKYLQPHNCLTINELISLIDRACEMLARGFDNNALENLEKRIEGLLLHHFELPECNERVTARYEILTEKHMKDNLYYCQGCHKLKTIETFDISARSKEPKMCASCKFIDKSKEPWVDISPYRFILRQIRRTERLLRSYSSLAFIIQEKDIYYIVTQIWHAHSALSECNDIYKLRLCRWDKNKDWSPWNCILLTVEEAKAHLRIEKLETVYDENFLSHVFSKHALTKKYFAQILEIERCVKKSETKDIYADSTTKICKIHESLQ